MKNCQFFSKIANGSNEQKRNANDDDDDDDDDDFFFVVWLTNEGNIIMIKQHQDMWKLFN